MLNVRTDNSALATRSIALPATVTASTEGGTWKRFAKAQPPCSEREDGKQSKRLGNHHRLP
jgi:hypothetical protein